MLTLIFVAIAYATSRSDVTTIEYKVDCSSMVVSCMERSETSTVFVPYTKKFICTLDMNDNFYTSCDEVHTLFIYKYNRYDVLKNTTGEIQQFHMVKTSERIAYYNIMVITGIITGFFIVIAFISYVCSVCNPKWLWVLVMSAIFAVMGFIAVIIIEIISRTQSS